MSLVTAGRYAPRRPAGMEPAGPHATRRELRSLSQLCRDSPSQGSAHQIPARPHCRTRTGALQARSWRQSARCLVRRSSQGAPAAPWQARCKSATRLALRRFVAGSPNLTSVLPFCDDSALDHTRDEGSLGGVEHGSRLYVGDLSFHATSEPLVTRSRRAGKSTTCTSCSTGKAAGRAVLRLSRWISRGSPQGA